MRARLFSLFFIHCLLLNLTAMSGSNVVMLWDKSLDVPTLVVSFSAALLPTLLMSFYMAKTKATARYGVRVENGMNLAFLLSEPKTNYWQIGCYYLTVVLLWIVVFWELQ